ncbi:MAG: hypothetical protein JF600_00405 [Xanthomonadales bacterium]|nr:hypothetical protein [Xanthomonadales bacterium]
MRIVISAAVFAAVLLSGCAGHATPAAVKAAPPPPVSTKGGNRFEMTQHGRQMTADDFDAWMKARGIRIAKGAQAAGRPPAGRSPKPAAKPVRATAAKADAKADQARGAAAPKRR